MLDKPIWLDDRVLFGDFEFRLQPNENDHKARSQENCFILYKEKDTFQQYEGLFGSLPSPACPKPSRASDRKYLSRKTRGDIAVAAMRKFAECTQSMSANGKGPQIDIIAQEVPDTNEQRNHLRNYGFSRGRLRSSSPWLLDLHSS